MEAGLSQKKGGGRKKRKVGGRKREWRRRDGLTPVTDMYTFQKYCCSPVSVHLSETPSPGVSFSDRCSPQGGETAAAAPHYTHPGSSHKGVRMQLF